jgi:hypothetical protein
MCRACRDQERKRSLADRLWEKVEKSDGCWMWRGARNNRGYGIIAIGHATPMLAHRAAYILTYGPIPPNLQVCHRCDTPGCVNPSHLFLGTALDNYLDSVAKGRATVGIQGENARLTEDQVRAIRQTTGVPLKDIAAIYGISASHVSYIRSRRAWKHVK